MPSEAARIADALTERDVALLRFDAHLKRRMEAWFMDLRDQLARELQAADLTGVAQRYREGRLRRLIQRAREKMAAAYTGAATELRGELVALSKAEGALLADLLGSTASLANVSLVLLTDKELGRALVANTLLEGATTSQWWGRQKAATLRRFSDAVRSGMVAGDSMGELVQRVRGKSTGRRVTRIVNGKRRVFHVFSGGAMQVSTREAYNLAHHARQSVATAARREMLAANSEVVKGIEQFSTLDTRTTDVCVAYDGESWTLPDYTPTGPKGLPYNSGVPRHWGCRSTEVPVLKSWKELGINAAEAGEGTRASLDGAIPGGKKFADVLPTWSHARQNALLGARRAQLWRDGKITLRDLLDPKTGQPRTLAELGS